MKKFLPFFLFVIIFIAWSLYRYFFNFPEWADEIIFKNIIMFLPVLLVVKLIEHKPLTSLGISEKNFFQNFMLGLGVGVFFSLEAIVTRSLKYGSFTFNPNHLSGIMFLSPLFLSLITAFVEETVYRGYFLTRLLFMFKNTFSANLLSSIFFTVIHIPLFIFVNHYSIPDLFSSFFMVFILGIINGILFSKTKNITASIMTHAVWNSSAIFF